MTTELASRPTISHDLQEKVLLGGDLSKLTAGERLSYYNAVCTSVGLNPLTRPFEYLYLNNKMVLYARKDCTDQLREKHEVSIQIVARELVDGVYVVTAKATNQNNRSDESIGAVPLPTSPPDKANAMMKSETKAKRRVTLSICGLGMLDETEIDTIPGATVVTTGPSLPTGAEMLAKIEAKEAPGSVLEPPTEEILKEMKRDMEPPTGTDAQLHEFLEKFNLVEYIKAWAELKNDSLEYSWTPEQSKMINDRSGLALKRLKDGERKKK